MYPLHFIKNCSQVSFIVIHLVIGIICFVGTIGKDDDVWIQVLESMSLNMVSFH